MSNPCNKFYKNFSLYHYLINHTSTNLDLPIKEEVIDKNSHIYRPPNNNGFIYEVISGAVKLGSYTDLGEEYVHDVLSQGDFFGNLKYLNGQFFEFSKTLMVSRLRLYPLSYFKTTIVNDPLLSDWFISYIIKRWCTSEKKIGNITGNKIEERIAYLKILFDATIEDANGQTHQLFTLLTQKDLGDLSGATRQTISAILKKN